MKSKYRVWPILAALVACAMVYASNLTAKEDHAAFGVTLAASTVDTSAVNAPSVDANYSNAINIDGAAVLGLEVTHDQLGSTQLAGYAPGADRIVDVASTTAASPEVLAGVLRRTSRSNYVS